MLSKKKREKEKETIIKLLIALIHARYDHSFTSCLMIL